MGQTLSPSGGARTGGEKGVKLEASKIPFYSKIELHRCSNNFLIFVQTP